MTDESYEEWLADFGARCPTTGDLERLLTRSRQTNDDDLRGLVKSHMFLRRLVRDAVLPAISDPSGGPQVVWQPSFIATLRRLVSDDQRAPDV
jgi:hypothetical protein